METKAIRKENVSLALIQPSAFNTRKNFDEAALKELSDSIASQGVLQQIGLRPIADTDRYEIIFGERRYRASVMAGLQLFSGLDNKMPERNIPIQTYAIFFVICIIRWL